MKRIALMRVAGMLGVLAVAGCAGQQPVGQEVGSRMDTPIQNVQGLPKWVTQKGAAFSGERRVFYGVGNAAGLVNPSLRRKAAEAAARRDVADSLNTYVAGMLKSYQAETTAGSMDKHSVEQHVTDTMKQVTEASLNGAEAVEYWENPLRNEAYALVRLDLAKFVEVMQGAGAAAGQYKELDAKLRDFVRQNAEKAHDELEQELAKKKQN